MNSADLMICSKLYFESLNNHEKNDLYIYFEEGYFVIEEVKKIIRHRWYAFERATKYGWLASYISQRIPEEDSQTLTSLANKIGLEGCVKALDIVRKESTNLHPTMISKCAVATFNDAYTTTVLRQRFRPKNRLLRDENPTVFTIS